MKTSKQTSMQLKIKLLPNKIYYWQDVDRIIGVMRVKVNGIDEIFGHGFMIEDSEILKFIMNKRGKKVEGKDFTLINTKRAITQTKIHLVNVYNALFVHGEAILDEDRNIDVDKYKELENEIRIDNGEILDTNLTHPFLPMKDFKTVKIDLKKASELNLI